MRQLLFALIACLGAVLPAPAQFDELAPSGPPEKARARLYLRTEGDLVRAAIRIEIQPGWHLYHDDLGPKDAVGKATVLEFESEGITWSRVRFPKPHRFDQPGLGEGGRDTYILGHEGRITLYALGRTEEGVDVEATRVEIEGLTCQDSGTCIPYFAKLKGRGAGDDELFADFPAGLAIAAPGQKLIPALFVRRAGEEVRAALRFDVEPGWHLYHEDLGPPDAVGRPTRLEWSGAGVEWTDVRFPEPRRYEQPGLGEDGRDTWIYGHEGQIVVYARGTAAEGADLAEVRVEIEALTCEDDGSCVPYGSTVESAGVGNEEVFAGFDARMKGAVPDPSPQADSPADGNEEESEGLLGFLALAVFWGLFTLLMPCTYPMIPITISFFTKQAADRGGKILPLSAAYGLGIVAIFVLIGVVFGSVIIPFATHPVTNLVIGLFFILFALALFGVINLQPPRFLLNAAGKASRTGGILGVFFMGATLVVTSFTCTAPFVGSLLSVGAADGDLSRIALGMAAFGTTMAVPFVLLSLLPGKLQVMPKSGEWMHVLKVFLGFVEIAAALKFLSNADLVWDWQVLTREFFLVLWFGIFLAAAMFLFGLIHLKGEGREIGPLRMVSGLAVLLFSLYCGYGVLGHRMDSVMTAIIPNYSSPLIASVSRGGNGDAEDRAPVIVKDDYPAAQALAKETGRRLLVNFTGFT